MNYKKAQKSLAPLLAPAGGLYAAVMKLRAAAYMSGIKKSQKPKCFCVSVGNISWGGSGKTPLADWLLSWSNKKGLTSALLTRGYGGKSEERPLLVKAHHNPEQSGDEPLMLARSHPEAYIMADPNRRRALDWVHAHIAAQFIVLDDGMQHMAVRRDLNLVLLRAKDLQTGIWGRVIPAGEWREGPDALKRASAFLLRMPQKLFEESAELIQKRLGRYEKPVFSFDLYPVRLMPLDKTAQPVNNLGGRPYALCTGVGSPEQVARSAQELLGNEPELSFTYPDHHKFTQADVKKMSKARLPVVMTAKDAVKIQPLLLNEFNLECYVLESEIRFGGAMFSGQDFCGWFEHRWEELS